MYLIFSHKLLFNFFYYLLLFEFLIRISFHSLMLNERNERKKCEWKKLKLFFCGDKI